MKECDVEIRLIQADLMCMRELLRRDADWRYFLNPAASELPLVTVEEMENTLRHIGGSIVESYPLPKGNMHRLRDHPVTWRTGGNQVKRVQSTGSLF